jgi:multidrug efflux system outer membrane protein
MSLDLNASMAQTLNMTRLDYQAQQISYEQDQRDLIVSVEKEFYYLLTSESDLEIEKSNMDLTQRLYEQELINYNNGFASELDVLQAQVNAAIVVPTYTQAVADHKERMRDFLNVLGIDPLEEVQISGELDVTVQDFDAQSLIEKYLFNRSDIRSQELSIESLKNSRKLNGNSSLSPTLGLSASWSTELDDPFSSDSWKESLTEDSDFSDDFALGIDLSFPLDGFIRGSEDNLTLRSLDDQIESAEITLKNVITTAKLEIINLTEQLKTSEANLKLASLNIELAQKSYTASQDSYAKGTVERLDVEDAQQSLLEANQSFLTHQYNYMVSLIDLRDALNLDSIEDLKEINNEN